MCKSNNVHGSGRDLHHTDFVGAQEGVQSRTLDIFCSFRCSQPQLACRAFAEDVYTETLCWCLVDDLPLLDDLLLLQGSRGCCSVLGFALRCCLGCFGRSLNLADGLAALSGGSRFLRRGLLGRGLGCRFLDRSFLLSRLFDGCVGDAAWRLVVSKDSQLRRDLRRVWVILPRMNAAREYLDSKGLD